MRIISKYDGRCQSCGERWDAGEEIWWTKESGAQCISCFEDDKTNEASPVKPVQKGVTVRYNPPK